MRFVIIFIMLIVSFYTFGGKMAKSKDDNKWRSESTLDWPPESPDNQYHLNK